MTWGEFKKDVEELGVKDETPIESIDCHENDCDIVVYDSDRRIPVTIHTTDRRIWENDE